MNHDLAAEDVPIYLFFTVKGSGKVQALGKMTSRQISYTFNCYSFGIDWINRDPEKCLEMRELSAIDFDRERNDYIGANIMTIGH